MLSKLVTFIGLDAIGRVLKRAKQVGMSDFGQGYVSELFFFQNGVFNWYYDCDLSYKVPSEGEAKDWLLAYLWSTNLNFNVDIR